MRYNKKIDNFPLKFIMFFVTFTLFLFFLGPIKYPRIEVEFYIIMVLYIILFLILTRLGLYIGNYVEVKVRNPKYGSDFHTFVKIVLPFVLLIKITLFMQFALTQGLPEVSNVLATISQAYSNLYQSEYESNVFRQIDTFFTFLTYLAVFTVFYNHNSYNKRYKILVGIVVIIDILYNAFYLGTSRSFITYFIVFIIAYIVNNFRKARTRYNRIVILQSMVFVLLIVVFLGNVIVSRRFMWGYDYFSISFRNGVFFDYSNFFIKYLPISLKYLISNIVFYLSHGYYGFALTFAATNKWTYGLGAYRGLNSIISQIIPSIPIMINSTLPVRTGQIFNFDGLANWYTIFPWLISDYGYVGTLIYMTFVAILYQKTWKELIYFNNPLSFSLFSLLTIQYLFLTANNQLFVRRGESLATIVILICWFIYGKKYNNIGKG